MGETHTTIWAGLKRAWNAVGDAAKRAWGSDADNGRKIRSMKRSVTLQENRARRKRPTQSSSSRLNNDQQVAERTWRTETPEATCWMRRRRQSVIGQETQKRRNEQNAALNRG
ncbi:hypothetical protein KCP74_20185 [Salmonella enterica subsp. enterica]|nr:hypothetical protein KCP74_20185 [Salmonella enterica subsp. enterica]